MTMEDDELLVGASDIVGYQSNAQGDLEGTLVFTGEDYEFYWDAATEELQLSECNANSWRVYSDVGMGKVDQVSDYVVDCDE